MLNTLADADDTNPELLRIAVHTVKRWKRHIKHVIIHGKKNGEIQLCTDENKIADLILSLMEGASILSKGSREESFMNHAIEHIEYLIEGIKA